MAGVALGSSDIMNGDAEDVVTSVPVLGAAWARLIYTRRWLGVIGGEGVSRFLFVIMC